MSTNKNVVILVLAAFLVTVSMIPYRKKTTRSSERKRILFIHHSTGGNLIKEGNLRDEIRKLDSNIEFWDHNYNLFPLFTYLLAGNTHLKGLSDSDGKVTGVDYRITLSNNSPKEYAEIFARDPSDLTLKAILDYDVVAFKNCYPTTRITSDQQLQEDIDYYSSIRNNLSRYPNTQFVLLTPPPAREETTNLANAERTKKLVNYLNSSEFVGSTTNIHVFDFFSLLADGTGMLKKKYTRPLFFDSHPNKLGNIYISPIFAKYLVEISKEGII